MSLPLTESDSNIGESSGWRTASESSLSALTLATAVGVNNGGDKNRDRRTFTSSTSSSRNQHGPPSDWDDEDYDTQLAATTKIPMIDSPDPYTEPERGNVQSARFLTKYRLKLLLLFTLILAVLIGSLLLTFYLLVPGMIQNSFGSFDATGSWPALDFFSFEPRLFRFRINQTLGFTNYLTTDISFQQPFEFITNDTLVATMTFPNFTIGPGRPYRLEDEFSAYLEDPVLWETLWKRWMAVALNPNLAPPEWHQKTVWTIQSTITVRMMGMEWRDIKITKLVPWNGGLTAGRAPIKLRLLNWQFLPSLSTPGLSLNLQYTNPGGMSINFGRLSFSLDSVYRMQNNSMEPIHLLDTFLPAFYLKPGTENLTIDSRFLRRNAYSISSVFQLGMDFVFNETAVLILRNFATSYTKQDGTQYTVPWANNVLKTFSFMIQLVRNEPLLHILQTSATEWIKTTVEHTGSFGDEWPSRPVLSNVYSNVTDAFNDSMMQQHSLWKRRKRK